MARLRILILDSDEIWQRGLRRLVEKQSRWEICGETSDPAQALQMVASLEPDVVAMEAASSEGTMEAIRRSRPSTGVLVFAAPENEAELERAVRAGVRALATKSDPPETIRQAIEAVSTKKTYLSPYASEVVLHRYLGDFLSNDSPSRFRPLTPRERKVVQLLADGKSSRELAAVLHISMKTVENHRANAMRKLGARSTAGLVRAAIRAGVIDP